MLLVLVIVVLLVLSAFALRLGAGNYAKREDGTTGRFDGARELLAALPVRDWDRAGDFRREHFGADWSDDVDVDLGHNGCSTRDDILRRDLADPVLRTRTCQVQRGTLLDPYSGITITFERGPESSKAVEIDHIVSLADAWHKGARFWDPQRRVEFANDPRNLLAVSPEANIARAFRDAAGWLPPAEDFRCEFVARQVEIKSDYGLWVSASEKRVMEEVLGGC